MPLVLQVSLFIRFYGSAEYFNPQRYKTRDGIIPFLRFFLLYRSIRHIMAQERGSAYRVGKLVAADGEHPLTKQLLDEELREAFGD